MLYKNRMQMRKVSQHSPGCPGWHTAGGVAGSADPRHEPPTAGEGTARCASGLSPAEAEMGWTRLLVEGEGPPQSRSVGPGVLGSPSPEGLGSEDRRCRLARLWAQGL